MTDVYSVILIAIVAGVTMLLRFLPFCTSTSAGMASQ